MAGIGLWAPGFASPEAWLENRPDPTVTRPSCAMLRTRIGRYASLVARQAVAALEQINARTGVDLSQLPTVFGSAYGEIQTAFDQLDMIELEGVPSPARFKNSVHNAASGHFSIATHNMCFTTAIAAGGETFAMCLLEAWAWLEANRGSILVALTEESLPRHLSTVGRYDPLGLAFHLCADPPGTGTMGTLFDLRQRPALPVPPTIPERLSANPCASGLPLIEALLRRSHGTVPVELGGNGWSVELRAGEGGGP